MNRENGTFYDPSNMVFYGRQEFMKSNHQITRPLRVVFLTSVRDTGICDLNGTMVETGNGLRYMEGTIERTILETYPWWRRTGSEYRGLLADMIQVVGIITDDTELDMNNSAYPVSPYSDRSWIYPLNLATPDGQPVSEITFNIPSSFRQLPLDATERRRELKREFEWLVLQKTQELGGDIIISDHYMARIEHLIEEYGFYGRVLNIHPAVTVDGHPFCFRGRTPTTDAINRVRSGIPTRTGATLHIVSSEIDEGSPIGFTADTPVLSTDEPQWLRYRNYHQAKLPLFINGLAHYVRAIYPYLSRMDLTDLQPVKFAYNQNMPEEVVASL